MAEAILNTSEASHAALTSLLPVWPSEICSVVAVTPEKRVAIVVIARYLEMASCCVSLIVGMASFDRIWLSEGLLCPLQVITDRF